MADQKSSQMYDDIYNSSTLSLLMLLSFPSISERCATLGGYYLLFLLQAAFLGSVLRSLLTLFSNAKILKEGSANPLSIFPMLSPNVIFLQ